MPFELVNCTNCGGEIQLDDSREFGFCLYCGSKVKYIEALETKKIIIEHQGQLEINSTKNVDSLLEYATKLIGHNNVEALSKIDKALELNPGLIRAWELKYKAIDNQVSKENVLLVKEINDTAKDLGYSYFRWSCSNNSHYPYFNLNEVLILREGPYFIVDIEQMMKFKLDKSEIFRKVNKLDSDDKLSALSAYKSVSNQEEFVDKIYVIEDLESTLEILQNCIATSNLDYELSIETNHMEKIEYYRENNRHNYEEYKAIRGFGASNNGHKFDGGGCLVSLIFVIILAIVAWLISNSYSYF